jgi:hypothetical protein
MGIIREIYSIIPAIYIPSSEQDRGHCTNLQVLELLFDGFTYISKCNAQKLMIKPIKPE